MSLNILNNEGDFILSLLNFFNLPWLTVASEINNTDEDKSKSPSSEDKH